MAEQEKWPDLPDEMFWCPLHGWSSVPCSAECSPEKAVFPIRSQFVSPAEVEEAAKALCQADADEVAAAMPDDYVVDDQWPELSHFERVGYLKQARIVAHSLGLQTGTEDQ